MRHEAWAGAGEPITLRSRGFDVQERRGEPALALT